MSGTQEQRPHPVSDTVEDTPPDAPQPDGESIAHAAEVSAKAAAVIDEIDFAEIAHEALVAALFEPGEEVTDAEFDERAKVMVANNIQKGGQ